MAVRVRAFDLLWEAEQERRLERLGQALASLARAGGVVRRVQILERTVPADGDALHRYLAEARDRALPAEAFSRRSYEALLEGAGFVTQDHELFRQQKLASVQPRTPAEPWSEGRWWKPRGPDRLPLHWAVPLDRAPLGQIWAFFPTNELTTLSGVLNAPWKLRADRATLVEGPFNEELLRVIVQMVVANLDAIHSTDDPGYILDVLPARGRETGAGPTKCCPSSCTSGS